MSRRMVGPGRWVDEGPSGVSIVPWSWARSGVMVSSERPASKTPTVDEEDARYNASLRYKPRPATEICGRFMPIQMTTCIRRAGHYPTSRCRSREQHDAYNIARRERRREQRAA